MYLPKANLALDYRVDEIRPTEGLSIVCLGARKARAKLLSNGEASVVPRRGLRTEV